MNKKQKEALVLAMLEKVESYRDISRKAKVSPNTIKAISNRAGLDKTTSISSRAFELYVRQKTPVEVAIALNLEAEKVIQYHQKYFILLGCTEFTLDTSTETCLSDGPMLFFVAVRMRNSSDIDKHDILSMDNYENRVE
jgi:hypothetical protein